MVEIGDVFRAATDQEFVALANSYDIEQAAKRIAREAESNKRFVVSAHYFGEGPSTIFPLILSANEVKLLKQFMDVFCISDKEYVFTEVK